MLVQCQYKEKLTKRYLNVAENKKDVEKMLKKLDIIPASSMIASGRRRTLSTIITACQWSCHHALDLTVQCPQAPPPNMALHYTWTLHTQPPGIFNRPQTKFGAR